MGSIDFVIKKGLDKIKPNEEPCGSYECGQCKVPNPFDTDTLEKTRFAYSLLFARDVQKGYIDKFGVIEGNKKIQCEFDRIVGILKNEYDFIPEKGFKELKIHFQ